MVSGDKNIWYQQNHDDRSLSLVIVSATDWSIVKVNAAAIDAAISRAKPHSYEDLLLTA